eukprot:Sspe_Gene.78075::Locus_48828_Transcript_1_1_Confidence_1.000_Length_1414::g.78075::m.78075
MADSDDDSTSSEVTGMPPPSDAATAVFGGHTLGDLFGEFAMPEEPAAPQPRKGIKRRVRGQVKVIDPTSSDPEELLVTPSWMRKEPRWLQRVKLEQAGLVEPNPVPRSELVKFQAPSAASQRLQEEEWLTVGKLPHTTYHIIYSSSGGEEDVVATAPRQERKKVKRRKMCGLLDDPDAKSEEEEDDNESSEEGPHKPLYSFCLNPKCPMYTTSDLSHGQMWRGECCGLSNQPAVGSCVEEGDDEEEEELLDEDLDDLIEGIEKDVVDDDLKGLVSSMEEVYGPPAPENTLPYLVAALAAVAVTAAEVVPESGSVEEEEEEEEEE